MWVYAHQFSTLIDELNFILLFDYKIILPKYGINNTRFVVLEVCAIGKQVS
jgi:hypothetical protein